MKLLKYIVVGVLGALTFASCDDFLEDPDPFQSLPSDGAISDAATLETALIGAYDAAQDDGVFGTNFPMVPEIMADNGEWRGSFATYQQMWEHQMDANNGEVLDMWTNAYRVINTANIVLKSADELADLDPAFRDQVKGETLFLRGATYFEIVRYFGLPFGPNAANDLGVPVLTVPVETTNDLTFPQRDPVQTAYDQAEADLTEAASLLPDAIERGRANRFAALAYLARISFQKRDYPAAANFAEQVLAGPSSLTAAPVDPFVSEGSSEEIWAVIHTAQDNPGVNGSLPTFHHVNGRGGDVIVDPDLIENGYNKIVTPDQQAAIDQAGNTVIDLRVTTLTSNDTFNIEKYEDFANNSDDALILRRAEFMLMRAEAIARTEGVTQEAVDLLNGVRARALRVIDAEGNNASSDLISFSTGDFASGEELTDAIVLERRVEFAFEGQRFHDMMRLQMDVDGLPFDDQRLRFPIPQRDLDANSNLVQNPGY